MVIITTKLFFYQYITYICIFQNIVIVIHCNSILTEHLFLIFNLHIWQERGHFAKYARGPKSSWNVPDCEYTSCVYKACCDTQRDPSRPTSHSAGSELAVFVLLFTCISCSVWSSASLHNYFSSALEVINFDALVGVEVVTAVVLLKNVVSFCNF
jgi:hypothetical protein